MAQLCAATPRMIVVWLVERLLGGLACVHYPGTGAGRR